MAAVYKILGQSRPADTNNAVLYTVPAGAEAIISTITATNVTGDAEQIRIFIVPDGGSPSESNALVYDPGLFSFTVQAFTIGVTLAAGDTIQVRSAEADSITFQAFGQELS
jgi:hypothetical protein